MADQIPPVRFSVIADIKPAEHSLQSITKTYQANTLKREFIERDYQRKVKRIWEDSGKDWGKALAKSMRAKEDYNERLVRLDMSNAKKLSDIQEKAAKKSSDIWNKQLKRIGIGFAGLAAGATAVAAIQIREFASIVSNIGGWKGISGSVSAGANAQQLAARNWSMSTGAGRGGLTATSNWQAINAMASSTNDFNSEDIAKAQQEWVKATGSISGFNDQFELLDKMAISSGESIANVAAGLAQIHNDFQDVSEQDLKKIDMAAFYLSKFGEVPFDQIQSIAKGIAQGDIMGGNKVENFKLIAATIEKTASPMGGGSEAATAANRFFTKIQTSGGFGFGAGKINDPRKLLESAVVQLSMSPSAGVGMRQTSLNYLQILGTHATGTTAAQKTQSLDKWIDSVEAAIQSDEDLDASYKEMRNTVTNILTRTFNELSTTIGSHIIPYLKPFAEGLSKTVDQFVKSGSLDEAIQVVADEFTLLGKFMTPIVKFFGFVMIGLEAFASDLQYATSSIDKFLANLFIGLANLLNHVPGMGKTASEFEKLGAKAFTQSDLDKKQADEFSKDYQDVVRLMSQSHAVASTPAEYDAKHNTSGKTITLPETTITGSVHSSHHTNHEIVRLLRSSVKYQDDHAKTANEHLRVLKQINADPNRSGKPNK